MPPFTFDDVRRIASNVSYDDVKRIAGTALLIVSTLLAIAGLAPGIAQLSSNQEGGSSLPRAWGDTINGSSVLAPAQTTVNQGQRISTPQPGTNTLVLCTLGYIDHAARTGYTAAHCVPGAKDGTYVQGGLDVRNETGTVIGKVYPSQRYLANPQNAADDIALIRFADNVALGKNAYSGDAIVPPHRDGPMTICRFGATTQKVMCTQTADPAIKNSTIRYIRDGEAGGDSGGVLYIPGEGVVGLHKGSLGDALSFGPILYGYNTAFL